MSICYFDALSAEVILKILSYLDCSDLCRMKQTCRRINEIICTWDHTLLKYIVPVATNQRSEKFLSRCTRKLGCFEQIRISRNWKIGRYGERSLLYVKKKYIPWLHLSREHVWLSRGKNIHCYDRNGEVVKVNKPRHVLVGRSDSDVVNFQLKDNFLVAGLRDGSMYLRNVETKECIFDKPKCHGSDINSVDMTKDGRVLVSGCRDNCFSLWKVNHEAAFQHNRSEDVVKKTFTYCLMDRVWKVAFDEDGSKLAVGISGNEHRRALIVLDTQVLEPLFLPISTDSGGLEDWGILDIKWDGPNTLWTCGYDTYLRRWDLRTGDCEQIFPDPHASVLYCIDYDYNNTIITGAQLYGRAILWDIRQKNGLQIYFMKCCKDLERPRSSPVYSLGFDAEYLFAATDQNLSVLDFTVRSGKIYDYSCFCT